jgi:ribosomal protein S18 acetylase RimI-like enzyme
MGRCRCFRQQRPLRNPVSLLRSLYTHAAAAQGAQVKGAEVNVRRLSPDEAPAYRAIRLEALRLAPEAFGSAFVTENARPLSWFAARLEAAAVFGAFCAGNLCGIAGFFPKRGPKDSHKGDLWGMYVRPDARRAGVGRLLVEAVIEHASCHVEILQLTVVSSNEAARRLYAKLGFAEYGLERNALKADGHYWDEVLMAKSLLPGERGR